MDDVNPPLGKRDVRPNPGRPLYSSQSRREVSLPTARVVCGGMGGGVSDLLCVALMRSDASAGDGHSLTAQRLHTLCALLPSDQSVDLQLDRLQDYAKARGFTVVATLFRGVAAADN